MWSFERKKILIAAQSINQASGAWHQFGFIDGSGPTGRVGGMGDASMAWLKRSAIPRVLRENPKEASENLGRSSVCVH